MLSGQPVRLERIADHRSSVGFPVGHAPMAALLGVPVVFDGQVLGGLYLTRPPGEEAFSDCDELIATALAGQAAAAVDALRRCCSAQTVVAALGMTDVRAGEQPAAGEDPAASPVVQRLLSAARRTLGVELTFLSRLEQGQQTFIHLDAAEQGPPLTSGTTVPVSRGLLPADDRRSDSRVGPGRRRPPRPGRHGRHRRPGRRRVLRCAGAPARRFAVRHAVRTGQLCRRGTEPVAAAVAALLRALAGLRERGLRLAVDDAGSGFASLQHITQLNPEIIKLDIAFVRAVDVDPSRRAVTRALLAFATELGATLVAEGIETAGELDQLLALGTHLGQGYHLGRPGPAGQVLADHRPPASRSRTT